jgi:hypothetical protein
MAFPIYADNTIIQKPCQAISFLEPFHVKPASKNMEDKMESNLIKPKICFIHKCRKTEIKIPGYPPGTATYCPECNLEKLHQEAKEELAKPLPSEQIIEFGKDVRILVDGLKRIKNFARRQGEW